MISSSKDYCFPPSVLGVPCLKCTINVLLLRRLSKPIYKLQRRVKKHCGLIVLQKSYSTSAELIVYLVRAYMAPTHDADLSTFTFSAGTWTTTLSCRMRGKLEGQVFAIGSCTSCLRWWVVAYTLYLESWSVSLLEGQSQNKSTGYGGRLSGLISLFIL